MTAEETSPAQESSVDEAYCSACNTSYASSLEQCPKDGERLVRFHARPDVMIGRTIDERFEVRGHLGRGGMGAVYRAWQRSVDREVAIKVVDSRLSHDRTAAKRFLREARLASRLNQPSIVNVYDFGQTEDGILYLVMELLRGRTLAQVIATGGPMTPRRAISVAVQLCDALDAAHGQGIIHRDLKPQNVVVLDDPPGRDLIKVLDFGLAKSLVRGDGTTVTESDAMLGTPLYMAPETIEGKPSDQRSDLYAIGCMLHELISGRPPFHAESRNLVLAMHLSSSPPALPATVPAEVSALIEELLDKDPQNRPPSAAVVRDRMLEFIEAGLDLDGAASRTSAPRRISRPLDPRRSTSETATAPTAASSRAAVTAVPVAPPRRRGRWVAALAFIGLGGAAAALYPPVRDRLFGGDTVGDQKRTGTIETDTPGGDVAPALVVPVDAAPPDATEVPDDAAAPADAEPLPDARKAKKSKATKAVQPPQPDEPEIDFVMPK